MNETERYSKVVRKVSDYYSVSFPEMVAKGRTKKVCEARHVAMYLLRNYTNLSWENIGKIFNRSAWTVMHAYSRGEELIAPELQDTCDESVKAPVTTTARRKKLASGLRYYQSWRRGADTKMPNPKELGVMLDEIIVELEK